MSIADRIKQKLTETLKPSHLNIIDESHKHEGHAGHDGQGESHFRVEIVSASFEGQTRVQRQQSVYTILKDEMADRIHALSLKCKSPSED